MTCRFLSASNIASVDSSHVWGVSFAWAQSCGCVCGYVGGGLPQCSNDPSVGFCSESSLYIAPRLLTLLSSFGFLSIDLVSLNILSLFYTRPLWSIIWTALGSGETRRITKTFLHWSFSCRWSRSWAHVWEKCGITATPVTLLISRLSVSCMNTIISTLITH